MPVIRKTNGIRQGVFENVVVVEGATLIRISDEYFHVPNREFGNALMENHKLSLKTTAHGQKILSIAPLKNKVVEFLADRDNNVLALRFMETT